MPSFSCIASCAYLLLAALFLRPSRADIAASTFTVDTGSDTNFTFALNIPSDSDDDALYFHLSGSSDYSWIAVGCGEQMAGSMIFAAYHGRSRDKVTVSQRIATGHREPEYTPSIELEVLNGSQVRDDKYFEVNARCANCRRWTGGSIDLNNKAQPWIFALGPDENLITNSPRGMMRRHNYYGHFTINMIQAQGKGGVPTGTNLTTLNGASLVGSITRDHEVLVPLHAVFMAGTIIIVFPLGLIFIIAFKKVRSHYITQSLGIVFLAVGLGIGVAQSKIQNKTRSIRRPHQIIGILVFCLAVAQAIGGYIQHKRARTLNQKRILKPIHQALGIIVLGLGLINGGLGFRLGSDSPRAKHGAVYAILVIIVLVCLGLAFLWRWRLVRRKKALARQAAHNEQQGVESHSGVDLNHMERS